MCHRFIPLLFVMLVLSIAASPAFSQTADKIQALESKMKELETALKAMQSQLETLKAEKVQAKADQQKQIDTMVSKTIEQKKMELKLIPDWVNNVKVKGDLRYRYEWKDDETQIADRNRNRIRARLGIYGKVNDEVDIGFRLATGNNPAPTGDSEGSPTSTNQDLSNAFSSKNIWLDLAYFDYHPTSRDGLHVLGGKIKNPYYRVGNSNFMFDTDVTPEGIAATYKTTYDNLDVFGTVGGYYVEERSTSAGTSLWGFQAGATYNIPDMEKTYVTAGAGYFDYANTKGKAALGSTAGQFYGNKSTGNLYDRDFNIVQVFGEIVFPVYGLPFRVFGDYLANTVAKSSEDAAFLVGVSIGKCKEPGSWKFAYNYREVDADAMVAVLAEDTFGGGGTDAKGHTLSLGYQLAVNWQLGASYMIGERRRSNKTTDHDVVCEDLKFKF